MSKTATVSGIVTDAGREEHKGKNGQFVSRTVYIKTLHEKPLKDGGTETVEVLVPVKWDGKRCEELAGLRAGDTVTVEVMPWGFTYEKGTFPYHRAQAGCQIVKGERKEDAQAPEGFGEGDDLPF